MILDLSSLQKSVTSLESAIQVALNTDQSASNKAQMEVIRAGVIQNFEFTFEICWKMMKRWLQENGERSTVDRLTMKELFRLAAERELISDLEAWFAYHQSRNQTAHTYDPDTAIDVYGVSRRFASDARKLLQTLISKND